MGTKTHALILAAALLAGSALTALAGEFAPPPPGPERGMSRYHPDFGPGHWRGGLGRDRRGPGMGMEKGDCRGPGCGGFGMKGGAIGLRMLETLNLDEAQKSAVVDMMTENFRAGLKLRLEMTDAQTKLQELRRSDKPSGDDIVAANAALGAIQGKQEALRNKAREDFRNILTPDQVKKLDEMRARRFGPGPRDRDDDGRMGPGRHDRRDGDRGPRDGRPYGPGPR